MFVTRIALLLLILSVCDELCPRKCKYKASATAPAKKNATSFTITITPVAQGPETLEEYLDKTKCNKTEDKPENKTVTPCGLQAKDSKGNDLPPPVSSGGQVNTTACLKIKKASPVEDLVPSPVGPDKNKEVKPCNKAKESNATPPPSPKEKKPCNKAKAAEIRTCDGTPVETAPKECPNKKASGKAKPCALKKAEEAVPGDIVSSQRVPVAGSGKPCASKKAPPEPPVKKPSNDCKISYEEESMVMANCRSCNARLNPNGGGVVLTCFDCQHEQADRTCHFSKYDPKFKVSTKFFEVAGLAGKGGNSTSQLIKKEY